MKISLIIPAVNEEKWIGDCLGYAIKNSNGKFHEIIVVDNGSTDRTSEIASSFQDVKVLKVHEKSLMGARQKGFIESTGDVIAYIDADTHMPPGWYENIERMFNSDSKTVCVSGPYYYYDLASWKQPLIKSWFIFAYPLYLITGYMLIAGNFAIRREVFEKMGGWDTSIVFYGDDTDIARRAHKFGEVLFTSDLTMPTSARRLHNQGLLNTAFMYGINFFSQAIRKKSLSTQYYEDYR